MSKICVFFFLHLSLPLLQSRLFIFFHLKLELNINFKSGQILTHPKFCFTRSRHNSMFSLEKKTQI